MNIDGFRLVTKKGRCQFPFLLIFANGVSSQCVSSSSMFRKKNIKNAFI